MKTIQLNFKRFYNPIIEIKKQAAEKWRLALAFFLVLAGCVSGAVFYVNTSENSGAFIKTFLEKLIESDFSTVFVYLSAFYFIPLIIVLISGFSALGLPIVIFCPTFWAAFLSLIMSCLYCEYQIDGVVFSLIILIPVAVIYLLSVLIGVNESLIMSGVIAQNVFSINKQGRGEIKSYLIRFGIIIIINLITTLVQSACISGFGKNLLI